MIRHAALLAATALVLTACGTVAQKATNNPGPTISIGTARIKLVLPNGYCLLDDTQSDSKLTDILAKIAKGRARPLAAMADCRELARWRDGKRGPLNHFGFFGTLSDADNEFPEFGAYRSVVAQVLCAILRRDMTKIMNEAKKLAESNKAGLKAYKPKLVKIEATGDACYISINVRSPASNGATKRHNAVLATLVVKNKIILIALAARKAGAQSKKSLAATTKKLVKRFLQANGG